MESITLITYAAVMSQTPFDQAAKVYDDTFTNGFVGRAQRRRVWGYLDPYLEASKTPCNVLELNCGTGEDALHMAEKGHQVLATDLSSQMVARAQAKVKHYAQQVHVEVLDIKQMDQCTGTYDLIFSNFGGLNCLSPSELQKLSADAAKLLKPSGRFMAVIMTRRCAWERLYFQLKGDIKARDRRLSPAAVDVMVDGSLVSTWFYSPEECGAYFADHFKSLYLKPIGIGIPPSYLNPLFERYAILRALAKGIEYVLGNFSALSDRADHFLITFTKR
jgi:SAM-dependent methyltransferase